MSLLFRTSGDARKVNYSRSGKGGRNIAGTAPLEEFRGTDLIRDIEGVPGLIRTLRGVGCSWSIANPQVPDHVVDGLGLGLIERFKEQPSKSWAKVTYFPQDGREDALLTISIIMPEPQFAEAWQLFHLGHVVGNMVYSLSVEGWLRSPRATTENPTVGEFIEGDILKKRAIISDEIALQIAPRDLQEGLNPPS